MTSLPATPFTLTGGCFCSAISYKISVPELSARAGVPKIFTAPALGPQNEVTERLPIITIDHCNSCRRIAGALAECWFICPQSWMQFSLLQKSSDAISELMTARLEPETLAVLKGDEELLKSTYLSHFSSSENVHRTFCGKCGTHLTFHFARGAKKGYEHWPPIFDVAVGTMDKESLEMEGFGARRQGWQQDGIGWFQRLLKDGEEKFAG